VPVRDAAILVEVPTAVAIHMAHSFVAMPDAEQSAVVDGEAPILQNTAQVRR